MSISNATRDSIVGLQKDTAVFNQRLGNVESALEMHDIAEIRERLAKLEERTDKLVKDRDEASRRWVQFGLLAAGAGFTVGVQLIIKWLGK